MALDVDTIEQSIRNHRSYNHPIFRNWAQTKPETEVVGALFHQIQSFCAATRPGGKFADGLTQLGLPEAVELMDEVFESEDGHGPDLAKMAGFIINKSAGEAVFKDLDDQVAIESQLKQFSDGIMATLPGYDQETGLMPQTAKARAVFDSRGDSDADSTYYNIGVAVALEIISNRHLIPGEMHCLVESGNYEVNLDQPEMHYLDEHFGEIGAEQQHEKNALEVLRRALNDKSSKVIEQGVTDFLESVGKLWDLLDSALLTSGTAGKTAPQLQKVA